MKIRVTLLNVFIYLFFLIFRLNSMITNFSKVVLPIIWARTVLGFLFVDPFFSRPVGHVLPSGPPLSRTCTLVEKTKCFGRVVRTESKLKKLKFLSNQKIF